MEIRGLGGDLDDIDLVLIYLLWVELEDCDHPICIYNYRRRFISALVYVGIGWWVDLFNILMSLYATIPLPYHFLPSPL